MEKEIYSLYVNDSSKEVRCSLFQKGLSGDDVAAFIVEHSSMLSRVTHLNLSENNIVSLPDVGTYLPVLQKVTLYKNQRLSEIPEWILSLPSLHSINARKCALRVFPSLPVHKTHWKELMFSHNYIDQVNSSLAHIEMIELLYLDHNPLSLECIEKICQVQCIKGLSSDRVLYDGYKSAYGKLLKVYRQRKCPFKFTILQPDPSYVILSD